MALAFVQNKPALTTAATSHAVVLDAAPTQNNLVTVVFRVATAIANVTGPSGYTMATSQDRASNSVSIWYKVAGAAESATITFTTAAGANGRIEAIEFSGNATSSPLDKINGATTASMVTSIQTGSTGTLSQADEVAVTGSLQGGANGGTEAIDSSFTALDTASFNNIIAGYRIVAATTALNPTHSWVSSLDAAAVIATFKAAAATNTGNFFQLF